MASKTMNCHPMLDKIGRCNEIPVATVRKCYQFRRGVLGGVAEKHGIFLRAICSGFALETWWEKELDQDSVPRGPESKHGDHPQLHCGRAYGKKTTSVRGTCAMMSSSVLALVLASAGINVME